LGGVQLKFLLKVTQNAELKRFPLTGPQTQEMEKSSIIGPFVLANFPIISLTELDHELQMALPQVVAQNREFAILQTNL